MLPVSSREGVFTPLVDALFTATSAVCVTGLVVLDTGTYWSTFGQTVLLILFQIGGLGIIVGMTMLLFTLSGKFGLRERLVVSESVGLAKLGGIVSVIVQLAIFSLIVEGIGALIFYIHWMNGGVPADALFTAVFHAVSAFNNCGFDIFGEFKSLVPYQGDATIILVTAFLILAGSTGCIILADIARNRRFVKISLESKIVFSATLVLLVTGTLFFLAAESANPATLGPMSWPQKVLAAFFQAVTPRTAGFNAIDMGSLRQISLFFTMVLMLIGGAAGSVAGGIKVNTLGVIFVAIWNTFRGRDNPQIFGRRLPEDTIYRAIALTVFYLLILGLVVMLLSITETFPMDNILFEAISALGTVGLTTGITPQLSFEGRCIIILTMFLGRLAPLAFMAYIAKRKQKLDIGYPHEIIRLG
jgi:trk system potassium uptake protein TrkH